jgi:hypothetical protein
VRGLRFVGFRRSCRQLVYIAPRRLPGGAFAIRQTIVRPVRGLRFVGFSTVLVPDPSEEAIQPDGDLVVKLAETIRRLSEQNGEIVTVVNPDLVEQYKNRHPNWQVLDPEKVGHDFNADYLIDLEIDKLSFYERGANQQIYRGQAQILVSVIDVKNPDNIQSKGFIDRYPPRRAPT